MEGGRYCLICFVEYTSTGTHRATALKCGHLFGSECIQKWVSTYKRAYCPTCSAPCRKTHLRTIFAAKIEAVDTEKEKELVDKYIKENELRKALELEITKLKSQIEIMKTAKQTTMQSKHVISKIHMNFACYSRIHFFPDDSLIEFDTINQFIIISCHRNGSFGLYKYLLNDFSVNSFIKFESMIRDMKISPFNDCLCLLAHGKEVSLLNVYSEAIVKQLYFEYSVSAVSFSNCNRNLIFVGDMSGNFHSYNLITNEKKTMKVCSCNIHSIVEEEGSIYLATAFGVFIKDSTDVSFRKIDIEVQGICSSMTSSDGIVLVIFRAFEHEITGVLLGQKYIIFTPEVKQFYKHNDCFFNGYIMVCDDNRNAIKVLDVNTLQMVYSYTFKEPVVGFCGDSSSLIVLTRRGVYIYNNK